MVVRFDYQWVDRKQPQKARPACVAFFKLRLDPRTPRSSDDPVFVKEVIYLPISTKPPHADQAAVKIPDQVRRHLSLLTNRGSLFRSVTYNIGRTISPGYQAPESGCMASSRRASFEAFASDWPLN
jgi:hypothetical protein